MERLEITNLDLKKCVKYVEIEKHKAKILNTIATNHHFLDSPKDSILKYSLKAYHADRSWYCYTMCTRSFLGPKEFEEYYMLTFEEELKEKGVECDCSEYPMTIKEYRLGNNDNLSEEEDIDYINSLLSTVGDQDQLYRNLREVSDEQIQLDQLNQKTIDEMYNVYGFPKNRRNVFVIWLVVHHSADCAFKKRWLTILLENFEIGVVDIRDIAIIFKRYKSTMLNIYCKDEEDAVFANWFTSQIPIGYINKFD